MIKKYGIKPLLLVFTVCSFFPDALGRQVAEKAKEILNGLSSKELGPTEAETLLRAIESHGKSNYFYSHVANEHIAASEEEAIRKRDSIKTDNASVVKTDRSARDLIRAGIKEAAEKGAAILVKNGETYRLYTPLETARQGRQNPTFKKEDRVYFRNQWGSGNGKPHGIVFAIDIETEASDGHPIKGEGYVVTAK